MTEYNNPYEFIDNVLPADAKYEELQEVSKAPNAEERKLLDTLNGLSYKDEQTREEVRREAAEIKKQLEERGWEVLVTINLPNDITKYRINRRSDYWRLRERYNELLKERNIQLPAQETSIIEVLKGHPDLLELHRKLEEISHNKARLTSDKGRTLEDLLPKAEVNAQQWAEINRDMAKATTPKEVDAVVKSYDKPDLAGRLGSNDAAWKFLETEVTRKEALVQLSRLEQMVSGLEGVKSIEAAISKLLDIFIEGSSPLQDTELLALINKLENKLGANNIIPEVPVTNGEIQAE